MIEEFLKNLRQGLFKKEAPPSSKRPIPSLEPLRHHPRDQRINNALEKLEPLQDRMPDFVSTDSRDWLGGVVEGGRKFQFTAIPSAEVIAKLKKYGVTILEKAPIQVSVGTDLDMVLAQMELTFSLWLKVEAQLSIHFLFTQLWSDRLNTEPQRGNTITIWRSGTPQELGTTIEDLELAVAVLEELVNNQV